MLVEHKSGKWSAWLMLVPVDHKEEPARWPRPLLLTCRARLCPVDSTKELTMSARIFLSEAQAEMAWDRRFLSWLKRAIQRGDLDQHEISIMLLDDARLFISPHGKRAADLFERVSRQWGTYHSYTLYLHYLSPQMQRRVRSMIQQKYDRKISLVQLLDRILGLLTEKALDHLKQAAEAEEAAQKSQQNAEQEASSEERKKDTDEVVPSSAGSDDAEVHGGDSSSGEVPEGQSQSGSEQASKGSDHRPADGSQPGGGGSPEELPTSARGYGGDMVDYAEARRMISAVINSPIYRQLAYKLSQLIKLVDAGFGLTTPRLSNKKLVREIVSRRVAINRARRDDTEKRSAYVYVDVSGSCTCSATGTYVVAKVLEMTAMRGKIVAVTHSNGYIWEKNTGISELTINELVPMYGRPGLLMFLGDMEAAGDYQWLLETYPEAVGIILNNYNSRSMPPTAYSESYINGLPWKVKPKFWYRGVSRIEDVAKVIEEIIAGIS